MKNVNANTRKKLRIIGIPLMIIGIIIIIYSFITFFGSFSNSYEETSRNSITWFGLSALGMILLFIGGILFYFSIIRPVSKYIAAEASPAVTTVSEAFGKGVKKTETEEVIKIKCPHCGYLESEDAEFCSKCGKKL